MYLEREQVVESHRLLARRIVAPLVFVIALSGCNDGRDIGSELTYDAGEFAPTTTLLEQKDLEVISTSTADTSANTTTESMGSEDSYFSEPVSTPLSTPITVAPESTPSTPSPENTVNTTSERCEEGIYTASLRSVNEDNVLGASPLDVACSGDGKFLKPSLLPGSLTPEAVDQNLGSTIIYGHRTAHGGPFRRLPDLRVHADSFVIGDGSYTVAGLGSVAEDEVFAFVESVYKGERFGAGVIVLMTCGDEEGNAGGTDTRQFAVLEQA